MKHFRPIKAAALLGMGLVWATACSDSSPGLNEVMSTAAASVQAVAGATEQSAATGTSVATAPAVVVKDGSGNVMAGVVVRFMVTAGGGSVANTTAITSAQGIAGAGKWTLGTTAGANVLEAVVGKLTPLQFTATATDGTTNTPPATSPPTSSAYAIAVRYIGTASTRQKLAVTNAVTRWQSVVTRDLTDIPLNSSANSCWQGQPAVNERIDDLLIFIEFVEIDGPGKVLGEAGPCYVRTDNRLPILGHLKLDAADLRQMEQSGTIDDVVLHEIGHILGIGTMWGEKNLLQNQGLEDPGFLGANAVGAYRAMGGGAATVPVENTGGEGTRDGHWRESVFGNELMTGWVSGGGNPLSALTVASLIDLGYGATATAASSYTLGSRTSGVRAHVDLSGEVTKRPKFKVDKHGRKELL